MKAAVIAVTKRGQILAEKLKSTLPLDFSDNIEDCNAIIYICAVQIAVRRIAPFIKDKFNDPAVVVCDEAGMWVISLLSGHIGGANNLANEIAAITGATPVITTGSEVNNFPREPKNIVIGIGMRRGVNSLAVERAVVTTLYDYGYSIYRACFAASIDKKRNERGLLEFAAAYNIPLTFYTAKELERVQGEFTASQFVENAIGVDNICERAATLRGGRGKLIIKKTARDGVTVAAFLKE